MCASECPKDCVKTLNSRSRYRAIRVWEKKNTKKFSLSFDIWQEDGKQHALYGVIVFRLHSARVNVVFQRLCNLCAV